MSDQQLWERILRDSSQSKHYSEGNLILAGRKGSGSRNLISALQKGPGSLGKNSKYSQLITPDDSTPTSCPIQYSYINSKDIGDPQSDKISKVNIYTLELPELKNLLEFALSAKTLKNTLFAIVLDWENPWRFTQDLEMWIDIWHEMLGKIMSSLPLEEQDQLVKNVADYLKYYKEPDSIREVNEDLQELPLPEGVLQVNLGVPIMVICCKSDLVWTVDKNREQNDKILDTALRALREFCVTYGASLFYTSSKTNANVNVLYEYIMHRIYGFNFKHKPEINERDEVFIPSGWDSPNLIQQMDYMTGDKQFHDLLPRPKNRVGNKDEVSLVSDQDFLIQMKDKLERAVVTKNDSVKMMLQKSNPVIDAENSPVEPIADGGQKSSNKLHDFYIKLLEKGNKEGKDS